MIDGWFPSMSAVGQSRGGIMLAVSSSYRTPLFRGRLSPFKIESSGLALPPLSNYPLADLFHTVIEWLFGIKGAIESVSKISLRCLSSLTNMLLLPSPRCIYLSVRNTLCFCFVQNPLLLPKTHLWNKINASDRHCPRGSRSLHPAHRGPGLSAAPFCWWNAVMALCALKIEPHGIFSISKVSMAALIHMLL